MGKRKARIDRELCVACGACCKVCPRAALTVWHGCYAVVERERCVGCGACQRICPAGAAVVAEGEAADEA